MMEVDSAAAMERLGADIVEGHAAPLRVHLEGDLGAGKTTLVRGALRALGHRGPVKSPTYTLIEPYEVGGTRLYHLDLYRLSDPGELEYLGLRELLAEPAWVFIEWPEHGRPWLPPADLRLSIEVTGVTHRSVTCRSQRGAPCET